MHEKKKIYTVFTAFSITLLLTLWNVFANEDRSKAQVDEALMHLSESTTDDASTPCLKSSLDGEPGTACITVTRTRSS